MLVKEIEKLRKNDTVFIININNTYGYPEKIIQDTLTSKPIYGSGLCWFYTGIKDVQWEVCIQHIFVTKDDAIKGYKSELLSQNKELLIKIKEMQSKIYKNISMIDSI